MSVKCLPYIVNASYFRSQGGIIDEDEDAVTYKLNAFIQYIAGPPVFLVVVDAVLYSQVHSRDIL